MNSNFASRLDRVMTPDQFNQVVDAILSGKYSWACLLILRFAGYNPLHYIPYRTYNRLMKENRITEVQKDTDSRGDRLENCFARLEDLNFMEPIQEKPANVRGGDRWWGDCRWQNFPFWRH